MLPTGRTRELLIPFQHLHASAVPTEHLQHASSGLVQAVPPQLCLPSRLHASARTHARPRPACAGTALCAPSRPRGLVAGALALPPAATSSFPQTIGSNAGRQKQIPTPASKARLRLKTRNTATHLRQGLPNEASCSFNPGVFGADSGPSPSPSILSYKQGAHGLEGPDNHPTLTASSEGQFGSDPVSRSVSGRAQHGAVSPRDFPLPNPMRSAEWSYGCSGETPLSTWQIVHRSGAR